MTAASVPESKDVSVIIPSNLDARMDWLKHRLLFLYRYGFQGEVVVGVWEGHAKIDALLSFCFGLSPNIRVIRQDGALRFTERALTLAEQASGKFIIQTGDDDFLLPEALGKLAVILAEDSSIVCAQGRTVSINSTLTSPLEIFPFPMWPALEHEVLTRFSNYSRRPGQLFHALFRRADFIERYQWMDEAMVHTNNSDVWFEVIGEFYGIIKGRFFILDELFILRGKDSSNASRKVRASGRQFPSFLQAEEFSTTYKIFEAQTFRLFATMGVDVHEASNRQTILHGVLQIIGAAAFMRREPPPPDEMRFAKMLQQYPLHPMLERVLRMVLETKPA